MESPPDEEGPAGGRERPQPGASSSRPPTKSPARHHEWESMRAGILPDRPTGSKPAVAALFWLRFAMRSQILTTAVLVVGVLALTLIAPWLWNEVRTLPGRPALAARAGERIVTLEVSGMTCSGCAARVQNSLAALPGVSGVVVRHSQSRAYVICRGDVPDSALTAAVSGVSSAFAASVVPK